MDLPFCAPIIIQFEQAFDNNDFKKFLFLHDINARAIPARHQNKNTTESKHKFIRDILLRLKSNNGEFCERLDAQQAIRLLSDFRLTIFPLPMNWQKGLGVLLNTVAYQILSLKM